MASSCRTLFANVFIASLLLMQQLAMSAPQAASPPSSASALHSWLQSKLIQGFVYGTSLVRTLPPLGGKLVDGLQRRRLARGDVAGVARLERLRAWSSYVGLYRGVPALVTDLLQHMGLAAEIAADWAEVAARMRGSAGAGRASWPQLLARERGAVLDWAKRSLRKAHKALKGGAVSRLLADVHHELNSDRHFVTDLLAEAEQLLGWRAGAGGGGPAGREAGRGGAGLGSGGGGGFDWVSEQLTALAQQVFEAAREALFPAQPAASTRGRPGSDGQRQRGSGWGSSSGAPDQRDPSYGDHYDL